jgi:hypothetical protein
MYCFGIGRRLLVQPYLERVRQTLGEPAGQRLRGVRPRVAQVEPGSADHAHTMRGEGF